MGLLKIEYEYWIKIEARNAKKHNNMDEELTARLSKAISFDHFKVIFKAAKIGSEIKQKAFEGMADCAKTFDHWHYLKKKAKKGSEFEKFTLVMMKESAKTFDHRVEIHEASEPNSAEQNKAFQDLLETADTFPEWKQIFCKSNYCSYETFSGDNYRSFIVSKMSVVAKTEKQYKFVHRVAQPGSKIRHDMWQKIDGLKAKTDESEVIDIEEEQTKDNSSSEG